MTDVADTGGGKSWIQGSPREWIQVWPDDKVLMENHEFKRVSLGIQFGDVTPRCLHLRNVPNTGSFTHMESSAHVGRA